MTLKDLFLILQTILPDKVFYGINVYDNEEVCSMPYIVYQVISKRVRSYSDDKPVFYHNKIQITLVSKTKSETLEEKLEQTLLNHDITYQMISEFINSDKSVNRVYEISMEDK